LFCEVRHVRSGRWNRKAVRAWYDRALLTVAILLTLASAAPPQATGANSLIEARRLEAAGETAGALDAYKRAVAESGAQSRERGEALLGLADLEAELGRHADAVTHARQALPILQALGDDAAMSTAKNAEGRAQLYAGNYLAAEQALKDAVALSTRAGAFAARAEQLGNLGNVQFFLGRYADAGRYYDEALATVQSHSGAAWADRRRRIVLINQAILYQRLGRDREALDVYKQLLGAGSALRDREQAQLLTNLGVLYRRMGDPIKALATYEKARALFARDLNVDGELGVLKNRGIVLALDLQRLAEAERAFSDALASATKVGNKREMLHAHLYRAETILRHGDAARALSDYTASLALAKELELPEEQWKALYGLGRALPNPGDAAAHLAAAVDTIETIRENIRVPSLRSDFLTDKREVYDALFATRLGEAAPPALFHILERSHSRGWRERLKLPASVELERVRQSLPDRVLLLDYWNSPRGSAVIAATRTRQAVLPLSIDERQIKALIDALAAGPSDTWRPLRAAVSAILPPADWFRDIDHVVIVPDAAIALVPFELLEVDGRPLVARAAVSYTPTAATLLRSVPAGRVVRMPWRLQMRAFADPVFQAARLDDAGAVRGRLSGSADEVRGISSEIAGGSELYVGVRNQKAQLVEPSAAPILHLATHAAAATSALEQSRLLFSAPPGTDTADYLFLREAYELPLGGVELAVLSACDTERGQLVRGEGVQSFSRAFIAAGARSTVTTLWRVPDRQTADFMKVFYHHLQAGVARDEALRRAKLAFLDSNTAAADPHFWAAFVLTGDGLRPVPRAISWSFLLLGAGAVVLIVVAFRRIRRNT
jgi:tetratricopeptide (TPR) repeat protein